MKSAIFLLSLLVLLSCSSEQSQKELEGAAANVYSDYQGRLSTLQFPIDFLTRDLEKIVHQMLPHTLVHQKLALNKKKDSLDLKIQSLGNPSLFSAGHKISITMPVKVTATIFKRVLGLKVGNKQPVEFSMNVGMTTALALDKNWQLKPSCSLDGITWIKKPSVDLLIVKVELDKLVEQQFEENRADLESKLCDVLSSAVPIREQVEKVWTLLNEPHRVAKKPIDLWLNNTVDRFGAKFDRTSKDTLRLNIQTDVALAISPDAPLDYEVASLPQNEFIPPFRPGLNMSVGVDVPNSTISKLLQERLERRQFSYEGFTIVPATIESHLRNDQVQIDMKIEGDVESDIRVSGTPQMSEDLVLSLKDLDLRMLSNNQLASALNWLVDTQVEGYVLERAFIDLKPVLSTLDQKIMNALDQSATASKIDLDIAFQTVKEDSLIFTSEELLWYFNLKGQTKMRLKPALIGRN